MRYGWVPMVWIAIVPALPAETLQQAWDTALHVDHRLRAAEEARAAAAEKLESARSARLPEVTLGAGYTALDNAPASKAHFGPTPTTFPIGEKNSLSYQAQASIPLYTSGRIRHGIEAADAALGARTAEIESKRQDIKMAVAEAYVGVLRSASAMRVAKSHVASLRAHARDVANMYRQGMVSRNDLLSARVALADARQEAIKAQNALDLARAAYNRGLGRPLGQEVALDEIEPASVGMSLEELTEKALRQRAELTALRQNMTALQRQAAGVRAEKGPQVALSGGYTYKENAFQVHEGQWAVNLGVQWKLFDGGVIGHKAAAAERQAAASQEQIDDLVSRITLQVRQAWLDVQETEKRIEVTRQAVAQAEENLKVNRNRYENGLSTNTEVLDAETLRVRSQSNHDNAVYDAVLATLRLKRATGAL